MRKESLDSRATSLSKHKVSVWSKDIPRSFPAPKIGASSNSYLIQLYGIMVVTYLWDHGCYLSATKIPCEVSSKNN